MLVTDHSWVKKQILPLRIRRRSSTKMLSGKEGVEAPAPSLGNRACSVDTLSRFRDN